MSEKKIGYKMTRPNRTSFYDQKTKYTVGKTIRIENEKKDGEPCGPGLHLGKRRWAPLLYNARWPWRLFKCEYDVSDILGENEDKVRVQKLKVVEELDCWDLDVLHCDRIKAVVERGLNFAGLKVQTPTRKKKIMNILIRYVESLSAADGQKRKIALNGVKYHGIEGWGSVADTIYPTIRGSLWTSVRASIKNALFDECSWWTYTVVCSVYDSVWRAAKRSVKKSVGDAILRDGWSVLSDAVSYSIPWSGLFGNSDCPFLAELEILEHGAILYGIDENGIAHVIMPLKREMKSRVREK